MITIAVDVMGGDYAPEQPILGILDALKENGDLKVIAVGSREAMDTYFKGKQYDADRVEFVYTEEVIETAESPVKAAKQKKNSSLVQVVRMVKEGRADGCLSAGNSGALLVAATAYLKRLPGVSRPPLAPIVPTRKGPAILVDCGANVDARPEHLVTFAKLGSIYLEHVCGVKDPKVAIVNIGAEEEKGNKLVKEAMPLLKAEKSIRFTGCVEARDLLNGEAQVIVCDAFVGNVILKLLEGVIGLGKDLIKKSIYSSTKAKLGALLLKKSMMSAAKPFDVSKYGGAPLLGLEGLVVKCHGNAKRKDVANGLRQSLEFIRQDINNIIKKNMED